MQVQVQVQVATPPQARRGAPLDLPALGLLAILLYVAFCTSDLLLWPRDE